MANNSPYNKMELLPSDPLDRVVMPTSNNWLPNLKMPNLGYVGKSLHKPNITKKKRVIVKLKGRRRPIDVVGLRRVQRAKLMNAKARHIDNIIKDAIEVNDVEQRFLMRKRELERLDAQFKAGVLAFFTEGVVKQAETKLVEEMVQTDPDVATFDNKSSTIINKAETLNVLQATNERENESLKEEMNEISNLLNEMIGSIDDPQSMEEATQLIDEYNVLASEIPPPTAILEKIEEAEEEEEEDDIVEDVEQEIDNNLEEEADLGDVIDETSEKAEELKEKIVRRQTGLSTEKQREATDLLRQIRRKIESNEELFEKMRGFIGPQDEETRKKFDRVKKFITEFKQGSYTKESLTSRQGPSFLKQKNKELSDIFRLARQRARDLEQAMVEPTVEGGPSSIASSASTIAVREEMTAEGPVPVRRRRLKIVKSLDEPE